MARSIASRRAARRADLQVESLDGRLLLSVSNLPVVGPTYPNDPQFNQQWGLNSPSDIDVDAPEAWTVTTGSPSTIVAVIDSGVDLRNPDLVGRLWVNPAASRRGKIVYGWNFVNNNGNVQDQFGHGTHVAGVIAAAADNRKGVVGLDWNARIMPLRTLAADGSGTLENAVAAIRFAVDNGARVINASWGSDLPDDDLYNAIAYADQKGVVFVTAAGNDGVNSDVVPIYPAAYHLPNVLVVAAVDPAGNLASFSNYGLHSVDLAAPGVTIYSTYPPRTYGLLSGTSMAAPYVTGVVSLLVGLHPDWSAEQLVQQVLATVKPLPGLTGKTVTGGIVDAAQAVGVSGSGPHGDQYVSLPLTTHKIATRSAAIPRTPGRRAQSQAAAFLPARSTALVARPERAGARQARPAWRGGVRVSASA
ncbi:S8 family peptidase [Paludisphaera borealis]|uniref:Thermophilic serine proteinase n=1 Tax=Paludisphaera borealis TaxID=1387353 RepID=A0A1U7CQ65_9BACT|nr:S8 family peptidase [Paludisphaera borealis]APW61084.1 Thermophilic serine proteinase [Paludisphaera borealis]